MEELASRYGGWLCKYGIRSHGQPTRDNPPIGDWAGVQQLLTIETSKLQNIT
jgi:hypothetical protein